MTRKYDIRLLEKLKEREGKGNYKGQELIIKRLPDCDEDGAIGCLDYLKIKKR